MPLAAETYLSVKNGYRADWVDRQLMKHCDVKTYLKCYAVGNDPTGEETDSLGRMRGSSRESAWIGCDVYRALEIFLERRREQLQERLRKNSQTVMERRQEAGQPDGGKGSAALGFYNELTESELLAVLGDP